MTPAEVETALQNALDAALQQFLEDRITPRTREKIQEEILDVISDFEDRGLIDRATSKPRVLIDHDTRTVHIQMGGSNAN